MALDDRKKLILQAIVEDYIENAEPIGSRSIAKKTDLGLSAATIRNEMGDLEELGLLVQPHTSAGRVPSDLGFRFYVDSLMKQYSMTSNEINRMQAAMTHKISELENIVKDVSAAFSTITNLPTFGIMPSVEHGAIKSIKIVGVDRRTIMVIVSDSSGLIKNKLLRLREDVSDEFLEKLNRRLNENLVGLTRSAINIDNIIEVKNAVGENVEILSSVLELVHEAISEIDNSEVFMEGATNILRFPEYNNIEKIKEIFQFFDDKKHIGTLVEALPKNNDKDIKIYIGDENLCPELKDNSIILSTYKAGGDMMGVIGVIGPVRMDYARVVSGIEFFSEELGKMLNEGFGNGKIKGDDS